MEVTKMAIRALMLKKKIDMRQKSLDELLIKDEEFTTRESELAKALEEATTDEETTTVEEEVEKFTGEKKEHDDAKEALTNEIEDLKTQLAEEEKEQDTTPVETPAETKPVEQTERKVNLTMNKRNIFAQMDVATRNAIFEQEDVKGWMGEIRSAIKEKRAISNIGLTIPEVFLGYIRENVMDYSKLVRRVNLRAVSGEARMAIMGGLYEAIWTECCANLNEMAMNFNDVEVGCFKIGGYYAVCNANLEDSDVNLASEILTAIGQGIGYALDKAILYGKNTSANNKMPLGVVSRLVQTEAPSDYSATARAWKDLHETNVVSLTATESKGMELFKNIVLKTQAIDNDFSRGNITFVMNRKTYTKVLAESMDKNASGAIVAAIDGRMPVIGGDIEVLNFIPDDVIIAGYFDLYLLVERAGAKFAESEHVRFLQDQTVFKGTARYDGTPVIAEGFMAIGLGGATPTSDMTFAADTANS